MRTIVYIDGFNLYYGRLKKTTYKWLDLWEYFQRALPKNCNLVKIKYWIKPYTTFVAIKNGMHQAEGFAFFTPGVAKFAPADPSHVKEIYGAVMGYFGVLQSRTRPEGASDSCC